MSTLILCLHSSGSPTSMWRNVARMPALTATPVLAPALLGYPPNPRIPVGAVLGPDADAAHVRALLPADLSRLHLVGHSYGGVVALQLARELAPIVRSVWVYEPVLFSALMHDPAADSAARAEATAMFGDPAFRDPAVAGTAEWCERFVDYWNRPGAFARMTREQRDALIAVGGKIYAEVLILFGPRGTFADWHRDVPMTVAYGSETRATARAMAVALAGVNPKALLEVLPACGHMAPLTDPAATARSLEAHFMRVQPL